MQSFKEAIKQKPDERKMIYVIMITEKYGPFLLMLKVTVNSYYLIFTSLSVPNKTILQ